MNKKLVYSFVVVAILGLGVVGYASAEQMPFHERFAQRFNLNSEEVDTFMQEDRDQMQEQKLDRIVEAGKITEEQKSLMLEKKEQMREEHEGLKDLEPEERRERMQELGQEMEEWAEENGIDLRFMRGKAFAKGFHDGLRMGERCK